MDVGGVKRVIKVTDLVSAFTEREQTATAKKTIEDRLAELGDLNSIKALKGRIDQLDTPRRTKVLALLAGEDGGGDGDDLGDAIDAELRDQRNGRANRRDDDDDAERLPPQVAKRFEFIEGVLQSLAKEANGRFEVTRKTTLGSQVDEQMGQYPVFEDKVAAGMAKQSIMGMLAQDAEASPEKITRSVAGTLQGLLNQRQADTVESLGGQRSMKIGEADKPALTATGLKAGITRRLAERVLRAAT